MTTSRPLNKVKGRQKRVLVTGGSGFIGANLARRLIADGHDVHLLLRHGRSEWRLRDIEGQYARASVDLTDESMVSAALSEISPDWIFHLATYGAYPDQTDFDTAFRTNLIGTVGLVKAAIRAGFESFVLAGTSSEYGVKDHPPIESEGLDPSSNYAATKAAASLLCRHLAASAAANLVTLRLYSAFGPFEQPTRLIPAIIAESWKNRLPPLADPDDAHDFVYVDDVVDAFIACATVSGHRPGAVYNVGTGLQVALREVVQVARDLFGIDAKPDWGSMPSRPWDSSIWRADSRALGAATGWKPQHSFRDGLAATANWFDNRPDMKARYAEMRDRH